MVEIEEKISHHGSLAQDQNGQIVFNQDEEVKEKPEELNLKVKDGIELEIQNLKPNELNQIDEKISSLEDFEEESELQEHDDQVHNQSFEDHEEFRVLSEDADRESIESEGHDETDFRSSQHDDEEELAVQAQFSLATGKIAEVLPDDKRVEVEEEICKEVIVKRRRAEVNEESSTNSSVHEDEDYDIEMAIEDQVQEQDKIDAETTSEIETIIQEIQSRGDSKDEVEEEVLDEIVLTKKLHHDVPSSGDEVEESKGSDASNLVDEETLKNEREAFDEEESDADSFNDNPSQTNENLDHEGRLMIIESNRFEILRKRKLSRL